MQLTPREQHHFDNAVYFTAIRGARPSTRIREEVATFSDALAVAKAYGDGRTMIYAVSAHGSGHIVNA